MTLVRPISASTSFRIGSSLLLVGLLSACGSDSQNNTTTSSTSSITGTAATGAPVTGATITASCKNGQSYNAAAPSDANGGYTIGNIPATAYPCAIKLSSGSLPAGTSALYSVATAGGNTNITPLTTLVLAKAISLAGAGTDIDAWFASGTLGAGLQGLVDNNLDDAVGVLHSLMSTGGSGYSWPASSGGVSFNPFRSSFQPVSGNAYDDLLEQLKNALAAGGASYSTLDALVAALAAGGSVTLPVVPPEEEEPATNLLAGEDGISGTLNGTTYTYTTSARYSRSAGATGKFGAAVATSATDAAQTWSVNLLGVTQATGDHTCVSDGTPAVNMIISSSTLSPGASGYTSISTANPGGSCTITVDRHAATMIEGSFTATLATADGTVVGTVSNGKFHAGNIPSYDGVATSVHNGLVGSHALSFEGNCNTQCSFADGDAVTAVIGADNTLSIGGKVLRNPFNRKFGTPPSSALLTEIIWKDGDTEYAVSNNESGTFNEINIGKSKLVGDNYAGGVPDFLGQLTASGSSGSGSYGPVGLASVTSFTSSSTLADTAAAVVGTHDVAIYQAPSPDEVGPGKLVVSNIGGNLSFTLKTAAGTTLTSITVPINDSSCGDGVCVNLFDQFTTPAGGRRISIRDYYADPVKKAILVGFLPDGYIHGSADGGYSFRNNVLAFGPGIPAVFSTLAGSFSGEHETNFCGRPNLVNVTVGSNGSVRLQGKTSLSCASQDHTATWDGQDDYIIPTATGAQLVIDTTRIGGSQTGGGITMDIANGSTASTFSYLYSNFAGTNGHITLPSPSKQ